ncbi:MAG: molybdenum cofactor guanylyltransferase [Planctomycetaceae bacterium]
MSELAGIILCGGNSLRMRKSKALLPFGEEGETMLTHVLGVVREVCDPVVIVAAQDQALPELSDDVQVVRDPEPDQGPLVAFATGMKSLPESTESVFVCSCDLPLLTPEFITGLFNYSNKLSEAVIPKENEQLHPLCAIYRVSVLTNIESLLHSQENPSMHRLLKQLEMGRAIEGDQLRLIDPKGVCLLNVNRPEEYQQALEWYERHIK